MHGRDERKRGAPSIKRVAAFIRLFLLCFVESGEWSPTTLSPTRGTVKSPYMEGPEYGIIPLDVRRIARGPWTNVVAHYLGPV